MRKPNHITVDRVLLLYLLQLAEPHGLLNDVKLQQLAFLCELQMFAKGMKGLHFEFFRYAYGAFSKDLDNDLTSLRRKERVENFSVTEQAEKAIELVLEAVDKTEGDQADTNAQVIEILRAVVGHYGTQDTDAITKSVEAVEISTPAQPEFKIAIRDVSFHTILLVPSRIETKSEFLIPVSVLARINATLGY
ncbi:hypothetical protein [Candidatus Nitrospira bockiana]